METMEQLTCDLFIRMMLLLKENFKNGNRLRSFMRIPLFIKVFFNL